MAQTQTAHLVRGCTEVNKHQARAAKDRADTRLLGVALGNYDKFVRGLSHIQTRSHECAQQVNKTKKRRRRRKKEKTDGEGVKAVQDEASKK